MSGPAGNSQCHTWRGVWTWSRWPQPIAGDLLVQDRKQLEELRSKGMWLSWSQLSRGRWIIKTRLRKASGFVACEKEGIFVFILWLPPWLVRVCSIRFLLPYTCYLAPALERMDFPGGSDGKASVYNVRDLGSIPGLGRFSGEGNGNPLQYSCLENSMEEELGAGYYPWGRRESGTTEQLHFT